MPEMAYDVINFHPNMGDVDESLFQKQCLSATEKYQMLETRDKILRARIPKGKVRVEFATRLFGTCPDMCPEKERYMRQYQRQLTSLEMLPGPDYLCDHKRAIKVYSRSSADQEEPLPHELRPGSTLEMTLYYLLHNVVPLADNNEEILGDWYNFLWDRTRSIRKDITQQQLTNLCVVELMEKCARLHIHCSSRLCELDVHLFDPKLNDENLMKCLQSLEHLYDDLRRRDIKCPNEPEFRAYQIMMNLNEGDILWAVQQRPEWIQKSWEVQAAIKVHHCIFNKNFVGFFRIVKSFPYMFSCILHRYFYQVRYRGLISLCKSSAGRKLDVQLIYTQLQRMLGYGDQEFCPEFENFLEAHGLVVDYENDRILYNRKRFMRPDSRIVSREPYLIDSKQTSSTAEAINGGPLPENPLLTYEPHSSFTEDGYLKPGLVGGEGSANSVTIVIPKISQRVEVQEERSSRLVLPLPAPPRAPSPKPPSLNTLERQMQERLRIKEEIRAKLVSSFVDMIVKKQLSGLISSVAHDVIQANLRIRFEQRLQQQMQERLRREEEIRSGAVEQAVQMILQKSLPSVVAVVARKEIQRHHLITAECESFVDDFLESNLKYFVRPICRKTIEKLKLAEKRRLDYLTSILKRLKLRFILHKWCANAEAKRIARKLKEAKQLQDMLNFPASNPVGRSPKQILLQLQGSGRSPNLMKTNFSTKTLLDKLEKAESIAISFKNNVSHFVVDNYNKRSQSDLSLLAQSNFNLNPEYYRHCWKRRWSPDKNSDDRKSKYPRVEPIINGTSLPRFTLTPLNRLEAPSKKTDADDLLDKIKKFTKDTQKEKEHFASCEELIGDQLLWTRAHHQDT